MILVIFTKDSLYTEEGPSDNMGTLRKALIKYLDIVVST